MIDKNPADAVRQATGRGEFEALARAGHVVSGLLHLLIAYIVVRLAFGDPGNADQSGALGLFASSTGGRMALWAAVVAFVAMALWRIAETIIGPHPANPKPGEDDGWLDRASRIPGRGLSRICLVSSAIRVRPWTVQWQPERRDERQADGIGCRQRTSDHRRTRHHRRRYLSHLQGRHEVVP